MTAGTPQDSSTRTGSLTVRRGSRGLRIVGAAAMVALTLGFGSACIDAGPSDDEEQQEQRDPGQNQEENQQEENQQEQEDD